MAVVVETFEIVAESPPPYVSTRQDDRSFSMGQMSLTIVRLITRCCLLVWQFASLTILLSIVASIPILQLATLGYLLESGGRWARGRLFRDCLPGLSIAGRMGTVALFTGLSVIPLAVLRHLSASAHLIAADSQKDVRLRILTSGVGLLWAIYIWWAVLRGGKVMDFLWPAPVRFFREIYRPKTWFTASDRLAAVVQNLRIAHLMRLGFLGAIGTLSYLLVPAVLMIAGIYAERDGARGLLTIFGSLLMMLTLQYVPFLQLRFAQTQRLAAFKQLRVVRAGFRRAPWLHAISIVLLVLSSIPLYLLRIEQPPSQLVWLLCIFFVLFNLPAKFLLAWALRYADQRQKDRAWYSRWPAWLLLVASLPIYTLFLYLACLASWDGTAVIVFQHALLLPVPFLP